MSRHIVVVALVIVLAVGWQALEPLLRETVSGDAQAIDGDSLRLDGREIRLEGIDAPELQQQCEADGRPSPCGRIARAALARLIAGASLKCRLGDADRYGRWLARCHAGSTDINAALVLEGMAISYGAYQREEQQARDARRGIWAGRFEAPDDWRQNNPRGR